MQNSALDVQIGGDHYKQFAIQPVEFAVRNNLTFLEGCVIKRVCRHSRGGKGRQDIEKAIHELQLLLDLVYPQTAPVVHGKEHWVQWDCTAHGAENGPVIDTSLWQITQVQLRHGTKKEPTEILGGVLWGEIPGMHTAEIVAYRLTPKHPAA